MNLIFNGLTKIVYRKEYAYVIELTFVRLPPTEYKLT